MSREAEVLALAVRVDRMLGARLEAALLPLVEAVKALENQQRRLVERVEKLHAGMAELLRRTDGDDEWKGE